ncbi:hypothetical protein [Sphingomonas sp.]|uniref:hypothetical protein n=1 Tax=Sphingomonas sp. TaxID=28214 RepID=UPI002FDAC998
MISLALLTVLLLSPQVAARPSPEIRAAFRQAVGDYQMFVVPHCAPDVVREYALARAKRDRAFFRSLRGTSLDGDYKQAVADRAARDAGTVYECTLLPAPPPPPPPPGMKPSQPSATKAHRSQDEVLREHFAEGDRQFQRVVRLRDALLGPRDK